MKATVEKKEGLWNLQSIPFFKGADSKTLMEIKKTTTLKSYKKNSFIYYPDETPNHIFFVKNGRVKIGSYSNGGNETIKMILENGQVFGEQFFMEKEPTENYAQAMESSCLLTIDCGEFQKMIEQNNFLAVQMAKVLGQRLQKFEKKYESLIFKDARSRIVDFLKEMAEEKGKPVGYETLIMHSFTHLDIAQLTVASRQTVTSVLNDLKQNNLIYFDRKRILIRDLAKLK